MPHLTVYAPERDLAGNEAALIAGLTDAVVAGYGEWAREIAEVSLIGLPANRHGIGGRITESAAPRVTFGIRADAFDRPDAAELVARLAAAVTDAVVAVFGESVRPGVAVEFLGVPAERTALGGVVAG